MKILLHSLQSGSPEKKLLTAVCAAAASYEIVTTSCLAQLIHQLLIIPKELLVAVLVVHSEEEIEELEYIRDLFGDTLIILVLPDQQDSTISKGYKLQPRFLTAMNNDFYDVAKVVEKIAHSTICCQRKECHGAGIGAYGYFAEPVGLRQ